MSPRLLDLFCGAGGAAAGYHSAGFDVWGVDISPHTAYPFKYVVADATLVLRDEWFLNGFDVIHASPPCQENSITKHLRDSQGGKVKSSGSNLLLPVRELLLKSGKPFVIENVPGADMRSDLMLCGSMFGLKVTSDHCERQLRRHRLFESNVNIGTQPACVHSGKPLGVYGSPNDSIPGGGQTARTVKEAGELMGITWMLKWNDIKEAIPPAYTNYIGLNLLEGI